MHFPIFLNLFPYNLFVKQRYHYDDLVTSKEEKKKKDLIGSDGVKKNDKNDYIIIIKKNRLLGRRRKKIEFLRWSFVSTPVVKATPSDKRRGFVVFSCSCIISEKYVMIKILRQVTIAENNNYVSFSLYKNWIKILHLQHMLFSHSFHQTYFV